MKKYLLLYLCFLYSLGLMAKAEATPGRLDALSKEGVVLDKHWKYSLEDNPSFANPEFDDSAWDTLNPLSPASDLEPLRNASYGWLRFRLSLGEKLSQQTLLLDLRQCFASEVYLDGKLLVRNGTLGKKPEDIVPLGANLPPIALPIKDTSEHVLAIRFGLSPDKIFPNGSFVGPFLHAKVLGVPQYFWQTRGQVQNSILYASLIAIFFLLSLMHLSFHRHNPAQKANLYFAAYSITMMVGFLLVELLSFVQDIRVFVYADAGAYVLTLSGGVWTVCALSSLFNYNNRNLIRLLWGVQVVLILTVLMSKWHIYPFLAAVVLPTVVQLWLTAKALKVNKRGAAIIASGFGVSLLCVFVIILLAVLQTQLTQLWVTVFLFVLFLSPALGISIYLAREFALEGQMLQVKLLQVRKLSAQNLAQQREKQQILAHQNDELERQVAERTAQLHQSLEELKETQAQLIQSEKMASLGELSAGIAHEIQNPLNFVNNFSEVNVELLEEMEEVLAKGDTNEALALANDMKVNLQKINLHGKRADSIVKGMLLHPQFGSRQKEETDINALVEESLRLTYQGFQARDKDFQVKIDTQFSPDLPKIDTIPQDLGRVLMNLFNNAFYSVSEKKNTLKDSFFPSVWVITQETETSIEIKVKDNGQGIPQRVLDKVFQPFFTTKPTGQGTGLGLALCYDIITKGHRGELKVTSEEGEFAEFTIELPTNKVQPPEPAMLLTHE